MNDERVVTFTYPLDVVQVVIQWFTQVKTRLEKETFSDEEAP